MMLFRIPVLVIAISSALPAFVPDARLNPAADVPVAFVENHGQTNPSVNYICSGKSFRAWFEDRRVTLQLGNTVTRITFEGSSTPIIAPLHAIGATANYLVGNDPSRWQTGLPLFDAIRYTSLWPGVELTFASAGSNRLKAEYVVQPGADLGRIRLRIEGDARIGADGTVSIGQNPDDPQPGAPGFYQSVHGRRVKLNGRFAQLPDGSVGVEVEGYDASQAFFIDPSILFSGYFGGSVEDNITAVAIDSANNVVVAGWTASPDLPASNGAQKQYGGGVDAFVASFLPNGGGLNYCTWLGGSGDDRAFALAIDGARNVYITGWTSSTDFPVLGGFQSHLKGTRDAFVTKLAATGNAFIYSTYLGGSAVDAGYAIGLDATNDAVIVGDSTSSDLPVSSNAYQKKLAGAQDVFVAKVSAQGNSLVFLTYVGGSGIDHGSCLSVGSGGAYYFGGYTLSTNFPVAQAFQPKSGGGQDGFYGKLSADGSTLVFSSYLGGSGADQINGIFRDSVGHIVVAGTTSSPNFPVTPGAFQTTFGGETDGFITRFQTNLQLAESTFVGGSLSDGITAIAQDFHGVPYVTGYTNSPDFPVQLPLQAANAGGLDAFVVKMNPALSAMTFGTYLGGSGNDGGNAIAVDFETSIIVGGQTGSADFPVAGNLPGSSSEVLSSFITKIAPSFTIGVAWGSQGALTVTTDPWHIAADPQSTNFGLATDLPVVGDWDGTGRKRIGIFRNGTWILDMDGSGAIDSNSKTVSFGQAGDIPVVGDWLGTGRIALGLFRQGTFILDQSGHLTGIPTGQSDATFPFGQAGDVPVAADWNHSGTTKVGVFRNGLWLVDYTGSRIYSNATSYVYGQAGDLPVVGDWDSSGYPSKIGIYRSGLWVFDYDGDNAWTTPYINEMVLGFGTSGYTPLVF